MEMYSITTRLRRHSDATLPTHSNTDCPRKRRSGRQLFVQTSVKSYGLPLYSLRFVSRSFVRRWTDLSERGMATPLVIERFDVIA